MRFKDSLGYQVKVSWKNKVAVLLMRFLEVANQYGMAILVLGCRSPYEIHFKEIEDTLVLNRTKLPFSL